MVRWGILSTARINRRLIPELQASSRCTLDAVASRDMNQAQAYAHQWRIPHAYGNYDALLADPAIDVVYLSLPNDLHAQWTIRALKAGKHVLCEKPLCLRMSELEAIALASEETGKTVTEAFMYRHHPQTALFRQLIQSGEIGEVIALYSEFTSTFTRPPDNYRMSAARGGGALWDIGVYPVSFFRYLMADPITAVSGKAQIVQQIDMRFWGQLHFASGITGQFFVSFDSVYSTRTSVMGTRGRLDITHPYNAVDECKAVLTRGEKTAELSIPRASLYAGEVENMNDIALGLGTALVSLEESMRVLEVILALRSEAGLQ